MMIFVRAIIIFCVYVTASRAQDLRVMENLLHRIEALEEQGVLQQHRIDQQDKLLGEYEEKLKEYVDKRLDDSKERLKEHVDKRLDEYDDKLKEHVNKRLDEFEDKLKEHVNKRLDENEEELKENVVKRRDEFEDKLNQTTLHGPIVKTFKRSNIQERDERPRLVMDNAEGPVAFHATYDKLISTTIGMNQHLIFEDVHLNLGNAFHKLHGLFIASRPGIYIFSTSVMGAPNTTSIIATIVKNGEKLANAYAHDGNFNQGSVTAVAQLNAGDEVWVSSTKHQTATVYGEMFSSFMGCLIRELF